MTLADKKIKIPQDEEIKISLENILQQNTCFIGQEGSRIYIYIYISLFCFVTAIGIYWHGFFLSKT
jgi:hypothetical protein